MATPFDALAPMSNVAPVPFSWQWAEVVYDINGVRTKYHVLYLRSGLGDIAPHFDDQAMRKLITDAQAQLSGIEVVRDMPRLPGRNGDGTPHGG